MTQTNKTFPTDEVFHQMQKLYAKEIDSGNETEYMHGHSQENSIRRQLNIWEYYREYIKPGQTILDWGCMHAPDSCILRFHHGKDLELFGCDLDDPGTFPVFHNYAGLDFSKLEHPVRLPYEDKQFDVVVASGVLEHAAMDYESLKELHRILKDEGKLIISFLPNQLSYTEWISRRIGRGYHIRLYSKRKVLSDLKHYGFIPVKHCYHQFIPGQRMQSVFGKLWFLNPYLERFWPFRCFCANIAVVAEKQPFL